MNGVFQYRFGTPEEITPVRLMADKLNKKKVDFLSDVTTAPIPQEAIEFYTTARGCHLLIPFDDDEQFYGLGLQMKSLHQNWKKKTLRVNSDPVADTGDSHAPVPFYVSTKGYAVYVDTCRYASFYFGTHTCQSVVNESEASFSDNTDDLYAAQQIRTQKYVIVDIPAAKGADVYFFAGPTMKEAVQRYNMFSGGGYLPPLWGLGVWFRTYVDSDAEAVEKQTREFREQHIPCDVYGLEPRWQEYAYSCSYTFNRKNFPDPQAMIDQLTDRHYKINLWEHAFIDGHSPIYEAMKPYSGDYRVWNGLVPDFVCPEGRKIFAAYHKKELVEKGIAGFKLDECDNSDFIISPWSYPEFSTFPSGLDGEQMHTMMGNFYMKAIMESFDGLNKRQFHLVRNAGAFASDLPYVLYSDLYDHKDFIRSLVNSGFSGLSWTPEVRQCNSVEDLYRRVQSTIFSPLALINAWMIPHAPWYQVDEILNKENIFMENHQEVTRTIRELLELRTKFVPYLYQAYREYEQTGKPVFRALVMDYPQDTRTYDCDLEYLMGDSVLVAPLVEGETCRDVYLPEGRWHDLQNETVYEGNATYRIEADIKTIPVFIKDGSLMPFAEPYEYVTATDPIRIRPVRYGDGDLSCKLFEDDGETYDYQNGAFNEITLTWKQGEAAPTVTRTGNAKEKFRFPTCK